MMSRLTITSLIIIVILLVALLTLWLKYTVARDSLLATEKKLNQNPETANLLLSNASSTQPSSPKPAQKPTVSQSEIELLQKQLDTLLKLQEQLQ